MTRNGFARTAVTVVAAVALLASVGAPASATADDQEWESSALYDLVTYRRIADLGATLRRAAGGIDVAVQARRLPAGHAITLWVVAFNHPEACGGDVPAGLGFGCTEADFDPDTTSLLYGGGVVVGPNGKAAFEASYATGDATRAVFDTPGVTNPLGAEVHVVLRSHGPGSADPDMRESQLSTYDGGCQDAQQGQPGPNLCRDLQFGFFVPPATPRAVTAACRTEGFAAVIPVDAARLRPLVPEPYTLSLDDTSRALLGVFFGGCVDDHPGEDADGAMPWADHYAVVMAVVDEPVDPHHSGFSLYDFWEFSDSPALAGAMAYMGKPSELVADMRVDFDRVGGLVVGATATVPWTAGGFSATAVIAGNVPDDAQGFSIHYGLGPHGHVRGVHRNHNYFGFAAEVTLQAAPGSPTAELLGGELITAPAIYFIFDAIAVFEIVDLPVTSSHRS